MLTNYVTNTCVLVSSDDFKPASVDTTKTAKVEFEANHKVSVITPNVEGSGQPETVYHGSRKPHLKECVLIIDHDTGEITLERLSQQIVVKKTRAEGSSKASRSSRMSPPPPSDYKKSPVKEKGSSKKQSNANVLSMPMSLDSLKATSLSPNRSFPSSSINGGASKSTAKSNSHYNTKDGQDVAMLSDSSSSSDSDDGSSSSDDESADVVEALESSLIEDSDLKAVESISVAKTTSSPSKSDSDDSSNSSSSDSESDEESDGREDNSPATANVRSMPTFSMPTFSQLDGPIATNNKQEKMDTSSSLTSNMYSLPNEDLRLSESSDSD